MRDTTHPVRFNTVEWKKIVKMVELYGGEVARTPVQNGVVLTFPKETLKFWGLCYGATAYQDCWYIPIKDVLARQQQWKDFPGTLVLVEFYDPLFGIWVANTEEITEDEALRKMGNSWQLDKHTPPIYPFGAWAEHIGINLLG